MERLTMDQNTNSKIITSFLPKGVGLGIVKLLNDEANISTGNVNSSRGTGTSGNGEFGEWVEVDVLEVVVDSERADEVFSFIYDKAGIGEGNHGFMTQGSLTQSSKFSIPRDLPREDS